MFNRMEVIGKVVNKPIVKKDVVSFEIRDSRNNLTEVYKIVAFEPLIEETVGGVDNLIEGLELLVQGPYKIKRDGTNKQIVCGADAILHLGTVSPIEDSAPNSEEEKEVETHAEAEKEDENPISNDVPENDTPPFPPSEETPSTEPQAPLSVEEEATEVKIGEFGLPHPDNFSLFESPQPSAQKSSTQTFKQKGSGKKGRFSVDDFKV